MSRSIKRSSLWRGKWWFRAGVLCCALLIPLSISTNGLRAAPLTRVNPPGDLSDARKHKWLAGATTFSVRPSDDLSQTQKKEWWIGYLVGVAGLCGNYGIANDVRMFMKKSPHFQKALLDMEGYDFAKSCGNHMTRLQKVLGQKEDWEYYLSVTYRTASEPEKNALK